MGSVRIQKSKILSLMFICSFIVWMSSCSKEKDCVVVKQETKADTSQFSRPVVVKEVEVTEAGQNKDTTKKVNRVMTFISFGN